MNTHELAAKLNGREYRKEISRAEEIDAKAAGLAVVFGASDDLLEFRGAIRDETGAYEGTTVQVDREGIREDWPEDLVNEEWARAYFVRDAQPSAWVEAVWSDTDAPCWTIKTEVPHATFEVMEDGETYCSGIVFSLADLPGAEAHVALAAPSGEQA